MQRTVDDDTAVLPLWPGGSSASPVVTIAADGSLLEIVVDKKRTCSFNEKRPTVSVFAFHPLDHSRAAFGLSDGSVYGVDIASGQLFLLTKVSDAAVTALAFSGTLVDWLICCTAGRRVAHLLDWETGNERQEWSLEMQHTTPVEQLSINILHGVVLFCSAGEVSCWAFDHPQTLTEVERQIPFRLMTFETPVRDAFRVKPILTDYGIVTVMHSEGMRSCIQRWGLPSSTEYRSDDEPGSIALSLVAQIPFDVECFCALPSAHLVIIGSDTREDGQSRRMLALVDSQTLQGLHHVTVSCEISCRCVDVSCAFTRSHNPSDMNGLVGLTFEDSSAVIVDLRSGRRLLQWATPLQSALIGFYLSSCVLAAGVTEHEIFLIHLPTATQHYLRSTAKPATDDVTCTAKAAPPDRLPPTLLPQYFSQWLDTSSLESSLEKKTNSAALQQSAKVIAGMLYEEEREDDHPGDGQGASFAENFHKLRGYLKRFGCYPSSHRAIIWRYMLGLPHTSHTTAVYAALARKPQHHCVSAFLEGLPLPQTQADVQKRLEKTISMLAWHSSVFGILECLPAILYPFVHVLYDSDNVALSLQTIVEVALIFFLNWGQEFFTHHPQAPPILTTFVTQLLEQEDQQLFHHFQSIGCPAEVWSWEVLQVILTDALTANEWLQMMDHALSTVPLWMWVFHVCLLKARRTELLGCLTSIEVLQALQTSGRHANAAYSIASVIQETYHLFGVLVANEEAALPNKPFLVLPPMYLTFQSMEWKDEKTRWQYPVHFSCHPDVLRERIREVAFRAQKLRELQEADHRRVAGQLRERRSVLENTYIQQQEERLQLAKRDAEAEKLQSEVLLGKVQRSIHEEFMASPVSDGLPYPLATLPSPYPMDSSTEATTIFMSPLSKQKSSLPSGR